MSATFAALSAQVLVLPGWQGSGPGHWQSRWDALTPAQHNLAFERVEQHDWMQPLRGDWTARLEEVVLGCLKARPEAPIVFAAHSLGCHLVAHWAATSPTLARQSGCVAGALLVAPPDPFQPDFPPQLHSWTPPTLGRLPFASTLVASSNDPFDRAGAAGRLAEHWGSARVALGACGHINAESGLGDWPSGLQLLQALAPLQPAKTLQKA